MNGDTANFAGGSITLAPLAWAPRWTRSFPRAIACMLPSNSTCNPASPTLTINRDSAGNITLLKIEGDVAKLVSLEDLTELLKAGESGSFSFEIEGGAKAKASANKS